MRPLSIFLVEDNEVDVLLVRESMDARHVAYDLSVAEDGEIGLRLIDELGECGPCPDIILLDFNLPRAEGGELLEHIRMNRNCFGVPVLVVTSSKAPKDLRTINEFGAKYFRKPSELDQYMKLVDVVLEMVGERGEQAAGR